MVLTSTMEEGVPDVPLLYADDNLIPLSLTDASQIWPNLSLNNEYTGVSGLNVDIAKTSALQYISMPLPPYFNDFISWGWHPPPPPTIPST
jgi:hypothetical protein